MRGNILQSTFIYVDILLRTIYTIHFTQDILHRTFYTDILHRTFYATHLHNTFYAIHLVQNISHMFIFEKLISNTKFYTINLTEYILYSAFYTVTFTFYSVY